jgi:predicted metal-dependent hydrolase
MNSDFPLVLAFVKDLNFSVRIESAAEMLGFEVKLVEKADQIAPADEHDPGHQVAEPIQGRNGVFLDKITKWQPSLVIFDLGNDSIPWLDWIAIITSGSATRGMPVLCYGSHVDTKTLKSAKQAGADPVVARSRFFSELPELIGKYARVVDLDQIEVACQDPLPHFAVKGLEKFNRGKYFEAHDLLERAWMEDNTPGRDLYRAILQVSVAYYQILRGNYNGAAKMFLRVRKWLDPLPDSCQGVNIKKLRQEVRAINQALIALGPDRIGEIDPAMMKPVEYSILN